MKADNSPDMLLKALHLPSMLREYKSLAHTAENESWSFTIYLHSLCQLEITERSQRRIERNLKKSNLPDGKTMDTLDQNELPTKIRRQFLVCIGIPLLLFMAHTICTTKPSIGEQ